MKKSVILTLCILLCLALSLGSTIAFLTDSDGDVNVMTLGRVDITLEDYQRVGQNTRSLKSGLERYQNDSMLLPLVGDLNSRNNPFNLPDNSNFHDKIVRVISDSRNADAYLRIWIGVPSELLDISGTEKDAVHLLWADERIKLGDETVGGWPWQYVTAVDTSLESVPYTMFCYEFTMLLKPGDVTPPLLAGLYLDTMVDSIDSNYVLRHGNEAYQLNADFSNGLQIPVLAQAVQATGFDSATQAFLAAKMDPVNMVERGLFDEYLDINVSVSGVLSDLIDLIKAAFSSQRDYWSYSIIIPNGTKLTVDNNTATKLNDIADTADNTPDGDKKSVQLVVAKDESVIINLTDATLVDNIQIVNNGGELIINGY